MDVTKQPIDEYAAQKDHSKLIQVLAHDLRVRFLVPDGHLRSNQCEVVVRHMTQPSFQRGGLRPSTEQSLRLGGNVEPECRRQVNDNA